MKNVNAHRGMYVNSTEENKHRYIGMKHKAKKNMV